MIRLLNTNKSVLKYMNSFMDQTIYIQHPSTIILQTYILLKTITMKL